VVGEDASGWALLKPGQVDLTRLEDFAYIALNDLAVIGKAVTESFYEKSPSYSYWTGCSTGGRQGMELAQRYPEAFDGILALAPAINWPSFLVADYWPQQVMNMLSYYPEPCELESLTAAAIEACDALDGLSDGVVSRPDLCTFTAKSLIGQKNLCPGNQKSVTCQAAEIADATWRGPSSPSGEQLWPGFHQDAPLTGLPGYSLAFTNCTGTERSSCIPVPFLVGEEWITLFVEKNTKFDASKMNQKDYTQVFHRSVGDYQSIIGTANPDLSAFKSAGGKLLSWQGLADQLVSPYGTAQYYDQVLGDDPSAADFYRLFFAPGTYHCQAGLAPYPYDTLDTLVKWVENGEAPDTLTAVNRTSAGDDAVRPLCPYPRIQTYVGEDGNSPASFTCA
jgi:feruloyl esterase